ncbi:MAG: SPFH domain-containing protein [Planctomycetota bacterium]|jgi:membrane protease subunit HflC
MNAPNDFPDLGGAPPPPPRRPQPPGGGGGGGGNLPDIPRKVIFGGVLVVVLLLVVVGAFITGKGGIIEVKDTEVAVVVNYMTGSKEIVNQPGYTIFFPLVSQAFVFDKSPNKFMMEGERDLDANNVSKLTVRANDGSNFWFETLEIQYRIIPAKADIVLDDSGPGDAFKQNWVRSFARSVLRDEFGRYSAEEVADPSTYNEATQEAQTRLNQMLDPHGIYIIQIITPKPKFEQRYERAIEDRKVADQEVEKLKTRADQLLRERERRLANIERDKATEYEQLLGTLEANRISAEKDAVRTMKDADAYAIEISASGLSKERRLLEEARGREAQARKEAEGLEARVEALAARGDILVREALAAKLARITFEIVPYRRDPAPTRVELLGQSPVGAREAQQ